MGWGYFTNGECQPPKVNSTTFNVAPVVSTTKWLSYRGMHQVHITERWAHDRIGPMQLAHFNGVGYNSWENVWGIWNGFTPRAGEALKRLKRGWKYLGDEQFLHNYTDWIPYSPQISNRSEFVYGSKFIQ